MTSLNASKFGLKIGRYRWRVLVLPDDGAYSVMAECEANLSLIICMAGFEHKSDAQLAWAEFAIQNEIYHWRYSDD